MGLFQKFAITKLTAPRCKHMCCRDGIDKAPKPRKSALTLEKPPKVPKPDSQTLSMHRVQTIPKRVIDHSKSAARKPNTEVLDMTSGIRKATRQNDNFTKRASQSLGPMQNLDDNIVSDNPMNKIIPEKSTSQNRKGQLSQSQKESQNVALNCKTSSDYGGEWMDDLPSPSALLGKPNYTQDRQDCEPTESDYGLSGTELEDTVFLPDDLMPSQSSAAYNVLKNNRNLPQTDERNQSHRIILHSPTLENFPTTHERSQKTSSLFLHTSSPEKAIHCIQATPNSLGAPETTTEVVTPELWIDEPALKRRRIVSQYPAIPQELPANTHNESCDTISFDETVDTSSHVHGSFGVDPDLLAEFGDIVDFV